MTITDSFLQEMTKNCGADFVSYERVCEQNSVRVLNAFISSGICAEHLQGSTGYGYGDVGRDKTDAVFAAALEAEDCLVRHNFVNGTHAIATALFGVLRPGDLLLSVTGKPYDTLSGVISGESGGSLKELGVRYAGVDLLPDSSPDLAEIEKLADKAKLVFIQRSRGYADRETLTISQIADIIRTVKGKNGGAAVFVDNCYGELCDAREPTAVGADLMAGSLIKNLGGGIAETGGYIAGRHDLVELCAARLTTPGIGREAGCTLNQTRWILLGLYHAPIAVMNAMKTARFASALFGGLGYNVKPDCRKPRQDIITAIELGSEEKLLKFCAAIQQNSPIDSTASPLPWDMPGYDSPVVMAAGAFTGGSSIELSADAPVKPPYTVWLQGGVNYYMSKAALINAAKAIQN